MSRRIEVHNGENVLDSRDIIERIEELEALRDDAQRDAQDKVDHFSELQAKDTLTDDEREELREYSAPEKETFEDNTEEYTSVDWGEDEHNELKILLALAEEASYSGDWKYGETLIRDSYFQEYAQDLAEDIGAVNKDASWPNSYIDWEAAANALKSDYSSVDFDGVTYWIRS